MSPSAGGAKQGIGDRVEDDVRVAMAGKATIVRNGDAAEHDRPFAGEGVDIEAHAGARDRSGTRAWPPRAPSRRRW